MSFAWLYGSRVAYYSHSFLFFFAKNQIFPGSSSPALLQWMDSVIKISSSKRQNYAGFLSASVATAHLRRLFIFFLIIQKP